MRGLPRIGSRVRIQFGDEMVEGKVLDAYDTGSVPWARVAVFLDGPADEDRDDPYTVSRPTSMIEPVDAA